MLFACYTRQTSVTPQVQYGLQEDHRPSCHSEWVERLMQGLRSGQGAGTFLSFSSCSIGRFQHWDWEALGRV